jgi:hypothetical protein
MVAELWWRLLLAAQAAVDTSVTSYNCAATKP